MDFYNPSEKIKRMRRKFRVNQAELEGENMTRAFISMMESGKRTVSKSSSKKLVEKFKKVANGIHVDLDIDEEYFCRAPEEDARYYCTNEMKKGIGLSHKELEDLVEIEKAFRLDDLLADTHRVNGVLYFEEKEYTKAYVNLQTALGKYKEIGAHLPQIDVFSYLGKCKLRNNQYEDAVFFFRQALSYAEEQERQTDYFIASHALATVYGQMEQYDKCLEILNKNILKNKVNADKHFLNNAKLMKANVLLLTGKNHEAAKEYFELVEEVRLEDEAMLGLIYNNIAEYYYNIENYEKALYYVSSAQKIKTSSNKKFLSSTLGLKGKIFFKQGMYQESVLLYELAIDMAEQYRRFDMLVQNYKELVKVLESINDIERIKSKMDAMISTLEMNGVREGIQYAIFKHLEIATAQNDSNKAMELLHRLEFFL